MLLMPNKKKIAALIISGSKPDFVQKMGESDDEGPVDLSKYGSDEEMPMGLEASAEKMLKAIKSGKSKMLVQALKEFMAMCEESKEDMGEYE